jgi:hypothetical protein
MTLRKIKSGTGHRYTLDGVPCTGVTTLIKSGLPSPALMYWSARAVAEFVADANLDDIQAWQRLGRDGLVNALKNVPWSQRDAAAVRGTEVHALAEAAIGGAAVEVPDHLAAHVDSCMRFFDEWQPKPVLLESSVASRRWQYAGTLDLVADLPNGQRALLDYKTGKGVYGEVALQLAAYRNAEFFLDADGAEQPMSSLDITHTYAVHLRADGYDVLPIETGSTVFTTFLHCAYVARQARDDNTTGIKTWVGSPIDPDTEQLASLLERHGVRP